MGARGGVGLAGGGGGGSLAALFSFAFKGRTPGGAAAVEDGGACSDAGAFAFAAEVLSVPELLLLELFALRRPMRLHNDSASTSIPIATSGFIAASPQ